MNKIYRYYGPKRDHIFYLGNCIKLLEKIPSQSVDLTITSPPYCMGKEYEGQKKIEDFIETHKKILPEIARVTKSGGSICWQVGYHGKFGDVHL